MARTVTVGADKPATGRVGRAVQAVRRFFGLGRGITVPLANKAASKGKGGGGGGGSP